jgi:hypothetical protein
MSSGMSCAIGKVCGAHDGIVAIFAVCLPERG